MIQITDRQKVVLDTIRKLTHQHGFPPTLREIGRALEMSTHGVDSHIQALARKGCITKAAKYRSRSIVVVGDSSPRRAQPEQPSAEPKALPKILVYSSLNPRVVLREITKPSCAGSATGVLEVRGESLVTSGIRCGDWLFIDEHAAKNVTMMMGTIVVLGLDEGSVVRYFAVEGGMVKLHTGDAGAVPFMMRPDDFRRAVLAVVVGLYRATEGE